MSEKKSKKIDGDIIRQLAALLREADLTEIEFEDDDLRIKVVRALAPVAAPAPPTPPVPPAPPRPEPGSARSGEPAEAERNPDNVASPMVGTVYRAPEPGARPFVDVGDIVHEGQTLLIIEAMKHMNEVAAPRAGRVAAVFVEDGQPVEYGEPLMTIE